MLTSALPSQLYGAAAMNNTLGLGVFAALVYFRNLDWQFSAGEFAPNNDIVVTLNLESHTMSYDTFSLTSCRMIPSLFRGDCYSPD